MDRCKGLLAILLCLSLCTPNAPAQSVAPAPEAPASKPAKARSEYRSGQIQGDDRILHVLNRFTFGPRPGDLDAVKAEGLDKWFEQQLHPATVDNSVLNQRLLEFPAMTWSTEDLIFRLPSDTMVRQAADGKIPYPQTGALHSVYSNQIDRYAIRKQAKEEKQLAAAQTAPAATANSGKMESAQLSETQTVQPNAMTASAKPEEPVFPQDRLERILAMAPTQRVTQLVAMNQTDFDSFRRALKGPQRGALMIGLDPQLKEVVAALENPKNLVNNELCEQRLTRDIYSNAQLLEVMTDFWMNHFNIYLHKNDETPYYLVSYERDVIRPHALGKFEDLLEATAHSPAMMLYLDNATSIGPDSTAAERAAQNKNNKNKAHEGLNENYARELMELHTLGVNGGYTQKDVIQVARVLTGWTVDRPARGGSFEFDEKKHEPGTKTVLGKKIKEHGELEGREVLHILASSPATAKFISRKLAIRFVSDDPPQSLVDRMAKTYMSTGGDISAVLRTLYRSPEFWSEDAWRAKVKTPLEYVVSTMRAANAQIDDLRPVVNALQGMGMPLYGAIPPTGYNWESSTWVSAGALVNRMNFALSLAANKMGGIPNDAWVPNPQISLVTASGAIDAAPSEIPSAETEEQRLAAMLVAGGVSESTRNAVLDQLRAQNDPQSAQARPVAAVAKPVNPSQNANALEKQDELLAGLLLGSPEFQRR